ncbi:hypothetical protein TNCV_236261 [Trichonephila clavipes]|nr:hypothetical protein TNCV_236261 [Trichonephila clavipes]
MARSKSTIFGDSRKLSTDQRQRGRPAEQREKKINPNQTRRLKIPSYNSGGLRTCCLLGQLIVAPFAGFRFLETGLPSGSPLRNI